MEFIGGEAHEFGAEGGRREAARLVKAQVGESLHADQWQQAAPCTHTLYDPNPNPNPNSNPTGNLVVRFQNYCVQNEPQPHPNPPDANPNPTLTPARTL